MVKKGDKENSMETSKEIINCMVAMSDKSQAKVLMSFFKTGKGQYGQGDRFLGIRVPQTREVVKGVDHSISIGEIHELLVNEWHEIRLCGFLLLVRMMSGAVPKPRRTDCCHALREEIATFYLRHAAMADNWDLVDLSAPYIIGVWMLYLYEDRKDAANDILYALAASGNLWERRIAIVSTLALIRRNKFEQTLEISKLLLGDQHDLIQKAVGWMLREVGKRDISLLRHFLNDNITRMSSTTLRYSIEKMERAERQEWLMRRKNKNTLLF